MSIQAVPNHALSLCEGNAIHALDEENIVFATGNSLLLVNLISSNQELMLNHKIGGIVVLGS